MHFYNPTLNFMHQVLSALEQASASSQSSAASQDTAITPISSITRDNGVYTISVELPGVKKEDISTELNEGRLLVEASRTWGGIETKYEKGFRMSDKIDKESILAKYENGLLTITVKEKDASSRKIDIQ